MKADERSEVKRSEPDGVRQVLRQAVYDFQQRGLEVEMHNLLPCAIFIYFDMELTN